jgi:archaellum component FlaC
MGVEEPNSQRFRPKGTQELVAQATSINPSNEGLKGKVNKLEKLASETKTTGDGADLEAKIDQLNQAYEVVKPRLSQINFISGNIKDMKEWLRQVLYPDFNINLAENTVARLFTDSRPAFDNSNEVDLIRLAGTVAKIKDLLTKSPYENSVLEEVKKEVLNLREILTQIVKQIYTIEETKDFLVKELASNGFLEPLLQHLGNLQSQVDSEISFLEDYLSYLHEDYSPGQDTNLDEWTLQKQQEMQDLEREIAEFRSINEKIIRLCTLADQQNQNINKPKTPEIAALTTELEELKK